MFDVSKDFPFLERLIDGKRIIYLDSAATTQKPKCVLDKISHVYSNGVSNVHRALNILANEVTEEFERSRKIVARLIGCSSNEIIFTGNATQGINLVANWLCNIERPKPKVLTTTLEHHSNLVPWLEPADVEFVEWTADGVIDLIVFEKKLQNKPDLFAPA
jgi:selenocysteine lyase/cysteine desulfurase